MATAAPPSPRYLTVKDVASMLQCSVRHIENLVHRGEFPVPIKVGRLARWDQDTVLAHLSSGTVTDTAC